MENEYNPWAMFHSIDRGDNLEEVVETEDCKVLHMNDPSGYGLMTIHRVFDGVYLKYLPMVLSHVESIVLMIKS